MYLCIDLQFKRGNWKEDLDVCLEMSKLFNIDANIALALRVHLSQCYFHFSKKFSVKITTICIIASTNLSIFQLKLEVAGKLFWTLVGLIDLSNVTFCQKKDTNCHTMILLGLIDLSDVLPKSKVQVGILWFLWDW